MFEFIKDKFKLRNAYREVELSEANYVKKEYEVAGKLLDEVLEARNTVVDEDLLSGWSFIGGKEGEFTPEQHKTMLDQAWRLYHENPHARAIVRNMVKFILGKGPNIIPDGENIEKQKEAWKEFRQINKFNKREKEICRRLFRDGEFFIRKYINKVEGIIKVRFIRANYIREPINKKIDNCSYGIKTSPEDVEEVVFYCLCDNNGNFKKELKPEEIYHEKIFSDSDQKRGVSVYRIVAKRLRQYEEWLEDRVRLNKVRSAIALVRQVDSSASKVKTIRDENLSDGFSTNKRRQKALHGGTVITASKGIEYKMISANINAADSADDGRAMLLAIAAAVGFPEMIFTADYSNANYSSSLVAQNPFVREIEDWQDFLTSFYQELFADVIKAKKAAGKMADNIEETCKVEFPPMIQAELEKMAKAYEILFKYKVLSKKTWRGKMGLDDEIESANIEQEEGDEVYPPMTGTGQPNQYPGGSPNAGGGRFTMPLAPTNQYGSELLELLKGLVEAVQENNTEKMEMIAEKIEDMEQSLKEIRTKDVNVTINNEIPVVETKVVNEQPININVPEREVTVNSPVTVEKTEINTPINVEVPERSLVVEQSKVEVINQPADIKIEQPINVTVPEKEIKINNIIEIPKKEKVKKTVQRDKEGKVKSITEEAQ